MVALDREGQRVGRSPCLPPGLIGCSMGLHGRDNYSVRRHSRHWPAKVQLISTAALVVSVRAHASAVAASA